jgi:glutathione S-transferase
LYEAKKSSPATYPATGGSRLLGAFIERRAAMLIVYDFDRSPSCLTTKILLNELEIPHESRWLTREELRSPDYLSKFPTGQAPAIQDGDVRIAESGAIALYLGQKHRQLIPEASGRRALMFQAMLIEASLLAPTVGGQGLFGELAKPEGERNLARIGELRDKAVQVGSILGELLGKRAYFADEFSLADVQLYAATSKSLAAGVFGAAPPNLVDWCERMTARPSVRSAREQYVHYRSPGRAA